MTRRRTAIRATTGRYARSRETLIEALERAHRDGTPVLARLRNADPELTPERVTLSVALQLLQEGRVERFSVIVDGREAPL